MKHIITLFSAMLLDLHNPAKVVGKMRACLMWPEEEYEFRGNVPQVIFPTAVIPGDSEDELLVYYGTADTHICLAKASLSGLIDRCLSDGPSYGWITDREWRCNSGVTRSRTGTRHARHAAGRRGGNAWLPAQGEEERPLNRFKVDSHLPVGTGWGCESTEVAAVLLGGAAATVLV